MFFLFCFKRKMHQARRSVEIERVLHQPLPQHLLQDDDVETLDFHQEAGAQGEHQAEGWARQRPGEAAPRSVHWVAAHQDGRTTSAREVRPECVCPGSCAGSGPLGM